MRSILVLVAVLALTPVVGASATLDAATAEFAITPHCNPSDFDHEICIDAAEPLCPIYRQSEIHGRECFLIGHSSA